MIKRTAHIFAVLVAFSLLIAACTSQPSPAGLPEAAGEIVLVDGTGQEIRLEAPAQKIVSLAPSNTEILFAVGAGQQVIAREDFSNFPAEAADLPSIGGDMGKYNLEEITRLQPDLILASPLTAPEVLQSFEEINAVVFVLPNPGDLEDLYENLKTVGTLTGRKAEADELVEGLSARASAVLDKVAGVTERPRVFYELDSTDPAKPWTAGPGTFVDMLIIQAGGQNVGASLQGEWAQISQEELIVQNPVIILLGDAAYGVTPQQVAERPGWGEIAAVENGQVYPFNDDLSSRPGPRMIDALEEMARIFHPDLFE